MKEEYYKWYSPNLSGDMEMLVYGHAGQPFLVFPTTMGRYYESKDFKLIDSVQWFLDNGKVQLFCVDSIDKLSWYNRHIHPSQKVKNHIWYDKMLREEIVEKIRQNSGYHKVGVTGASFGGYHAANFAFRHPDVVSHLFTMSGAFDIRNFMHGYFDDNVYFNNPVDYLPGLNHPDLWKMKIILGTSDWDICKEPNFRLSHLLNEKNVKHWLDCRPESSHDWPVWRAMFPHYLSLM